MLNFKYAGKFDVGGTNAHTQTHTRNRNKPLNFVFLLEERGTKHTSNHTPKADLLRPCCKKMCYLWGALKALPFTFGALDGFGTILWSRISARLDPHNKALSCRSTTFSRKGDDIFKYCIFGHNLAVMLEPNVLVRYV